MTTSLATAISVPIAAAILTALGRSRESKQSQGGSPVLSTPIAFSVIAAGMVVLGAAIHVGLLVTLPGRAQWLHLFGVLFSFGGAYACWDSYRTRHVLDEDALVYRGAFRSARVDWTQIASAEWQPRMLVLILKTTDNRELGFGPHLRGLPALAQALEQKAPQLVCDAATAEMLSATRSGELPSLYPSPK